MFIVIALQGSISAGIIGLCGVVLAVCAIGYSYARTIRDRSFQTYRASATITIEAENRLELSTEARRLLNIKAGEAPSLASLPTLVSDARANRPLHDTPSTFDASLAALIQTGAGFETMLRTATGDLVVADGQPAGSRAVIRFRAATTQEIALIEEVATRMASDAHAAMLQAANDQSGAPSFCIEETGQVIWRSAAFTGLRLDAQDILVMHAKGLAGAGTSTAETQVKTTGVDGDEVHFELAARPLDDNRIVCVATDVTRTVVAEAAFRRFVDTMSDTFAHLKISLMIFDAKRRLTLFNPATVEMVHLDAAWLAQRPTLKVLLDRLREARMTPEQSNFIEWRDRLLKATAPRQGSQELPDAKKQEDIWHLASGRVLKVLARPHPSGGLAVIIEDITDAMALQRQSVSERAVHIATTDVLEEALVLFAPDGSAKLSNAAFRSLWSLGGNEDRNGDVTGFHVTALANHCREYAPDAAFWDDLVDSVTGVNRRGTITAKLTHLNGAITMARISPVPDGSVLAVFSDITDSEQIAAALADRNNALEQAQEMRIALIDQISHQLRNPLNSIFGFGQMLSQGHFGELNQQQSTYIAGIATASQELLSAINAMTEIIDLDENTNTAPVGTVSIERLLSDVAGIVNRRTGVEFVRLLPTQAPLQPAPEGTAAQRGHLRQIIFNLITDTLTPTGTHTETDNPMSSTTPASGTRLAEVSLGTDDGMLVISCRRQSAVDRPPPTLAFAMASRLARILGGAVSLEENDDWRTLHCRLPLEVVIQHPPRILHPVERIAGAPHA